MLDRLPFAVLAAVAGWCLGWASATLTDWLQKADDEHKAALGTPAHRRLAPDPIVQGVSAIVWAALAMFLTGDWPRWAEAGLLAVPLIQVAVTDFRTRYVYTVIAWIGVVLGLAFGWQVHAGEWWTSLAGAAGGFLAFGVLYLLGRLIYRGRVEGMARGDITIAAMVGAGTAACTPQALFIGVLVGGVLAAGVLVVSRSRHGFMPYGPGLCLGGLATLFWC
ncbi:MAG: A24 family peptidase [Chloroflexota bacterium]|nr:A24 family peptidase [Chloroflexota bacterium]